MPTTSSSQSLKPITDTGLRGFLKWFAQVQPDIYKKIAPVLPTKIPQGFSGYHAGGWRVAGLSRDEAVDKLNRLNGLKDIYRGNFSKRAGLNDLSDYSSYSGTGSSMLDPITVTASYSDGLSPITTDFTGQLDAPITTDVSSLVGMPTVDTASAANTGPTASTILQGIASVISAGSQAYLSTQQAATQNKVVNAQLQRAAAGLAPLPTSLTSLGVPQASVTASMGTGTLLILLAGAAGLLLLSSSNKK